MITHADSDMVMEETVEMVSGNRLPNGNLFSHTPERCLNLIISMSIPKIIIAIYFMNGSDMPAILFTIIGLINMVMIL